jgi:ATP-dependent Clp protease ATP-binding subunit ClpA
MMVRFDMSEFQEKGSLTRFIGSADGAIAGALTDAIREKPYALLLLDEFEKADKNILNLFLQVLDEGRLTDGLGRVANFENAIIVATSNAYSEFIVAALEGGKKLEDLRDEVKHHLVDYFKPELINRFSDIIVFEPLGIPDMKKVTELQLKELVQDALDAQGIALTFGPEVIEEVTRLGFTRVFGARPLRRVIEEKLRSELANQILMGNISKNDVAEARYENEKFVFSKKTTL